MLIRQAFAAVALFASFALAVPAQAAESPAKDFAAAFNAPSLQNLYMSAGWQHNQPTGSAAGSSDTADLSAGYFVTPHIAAELSAGVPAKFDVKGKGDAGSAHMFAPTLMLKYFFEAPHGLYPFVGVGVSHVGFSDVQHDGGGTMSIRSAWEPDFGIGAAYSLSPHWYVVADVSYMPLEPSATIDTSIRTAIGSFDKQTTTKLHMNPIVSRISVGYRF